MTPETRTTDVEVVRSEERPLLTTTRVPVERVVVRKRVVSEVRTVEVTVRRELLEITSEPVAGVGSEQAGPSGGPLVVVLSEEVPVVEVRARPYERVTVTAEAVSGEQDVTLDLAREEVEVSTEASAPRSG